MPLANLTEDEKNIIYECLKCVATGKVILHDWEFSTIFGIEVDEFLSIVNDWPNIDDSNETVSLAINNSMNNLLGYPHNFHDKWNEIMTATKEQVAIVLQKWRGKRIEGYISGLQ